MWRTKAAGWLDKTRILLNSWKTQAYAGLPLGRLFPINAIVIFLKKWIYKKIGVQWKHVKSSTCYETLGRLTLRVKNSLMKSSNAKRHSECLVTKRSLMKMRSFEKSIQDGPSAVLTNEIQILFPVGVKGRYMFIHKGSTNLLSLFAFGCLTSWKNVKHITDSSTIWDKPLKDKYNKVS